MVVQVRSRKQPNTSKVKWGKQPKCGRIGSHAEAVTEYKCVPRSATLYRTNWRKAK